MEGECYHLLSGSVNSCDHVLPYTCIKEGAAARMLDISWFYGYSKRINENALSNALAKRVKNGAWWSSQRLSDINSVFV